MGIRIRKSARGCFEAGEGAFTLIELLVVIAVIALLLSILMPSLRLARSAAKRLACTGNLRQIKLAVDMYAGDNDNTFPCMDDPVSTKPFYWLWMGRGWRKPLEPYLGDSLDVNNPSVLLCPEDKTEPARFESTSYSYSMAFYHSPEQIDAMNTTEETYSNAQPSIAQKTVNVGNPSGKILIGEWFSNHYPLEDEKGWWEWRGCRNFLFADGQIRFVDANDILPARDGLPNPNLTIHGIKGIDLKP